MSRIIFEINYDIKPEKREEYLEVIKELKSHIQNNSDKSYLVVENGNRPNNFTEIYICKDEAEFESLEDGSDDVTNNLTSRILAEFIIDNKTRYTTLHEVD